MKKSLPTCATPLSDQTAALAAEISQLQHQLALCTLACLKITAYAAQYDDLTDLPNRQQITTAITRLLAEASNATIISVVYLNIDNLALINETLGFSTGDMILRKVASLLQHTQRRLDFVAKLGGDEFLLVLHADNLNDVRVMSEDILTTLSQLSVDKQEFFMSASIGIATYPASGTDALGLIKNAATAMRAAKSLGKNQYQFFVNSLPQYSQDTLLIINGLRQAVRKQELRLQFQPIIDLNSLTCIGIEALMRWQHPQLGLLLPETYLLYAEEVGVSLDLGRWVLQHACAGYRRLALTDSLLLCVNMSATEFMVADLEEFILATLREQAIPTERLIIELTETMVMRNPEYVINKIKALANAGIAIAIDDYGMGYSSLHLLKQLPTTLLKIDKSFITEIHSNSPNAAIVKSSIQLAHELGLRVVAEGVETAEEVAFLKLHGCDYVQGYYLSKPLWFEELTDYLHSALPKPRL